MGNDVEGTEAVRPQGCTNFRKYKVKDDRFVVFLTESFASISSIFVSHRIQMSTRLPVGSKSVQG